MFFSADGVENTVTSVSYDLDKQSSNSRNGTTELITVTKPQDNMLVYNSKVPSKGKSFSEALILASVNPEYGKRLFIEFPQKNKFRTCCVQKLVFLFLF